MAAHTAQYLHLRAKYNHYVSEHLVTNDRLGEGGCLMVSLSIKSSVHAAYVQHNYTVNQSVQNPLHGAWRIQKLVNNIPTASDRTCPW